MIRKVVILAIVLSGVWSVVIGLVIASARAEPLPVYEPLPANLYPGKQPTFYCCCVVKYRYYPVLTCEIKLSKRTFVTWITYNVAARSIETALVEFPSWRIGDLMLAWGSPTASEHYASGHYLYWGDRYAYVADSVFSPYSPVNFVEYTAHQHERGRWQGFRLK